MDNSTHFNINNLSLNFMLYKKLSTIFLFFICFLFGYLSAEDKKVPLILVSVAPHKFFVEKIAGETVSVGLIVPAASSAHTYEPTPRQMLQATQADLWFRIGESFETRLINSLQTHNATITIVDLRKGLDLIEGCKCCHTNSMDLHFWLSPRLAQIQAKTIADALIQRYPENKDFYENNLKKFISELQTLDQKIELILSRLSNRNILVSHPAYGYFCRDYHLTQYSIEFEGKDPTPQQLTSILKLARDLQIKTIFIQMQYGSKGARLIADEIGAKVISLDPYAEDYLNSMLKIANAFAEG